MNTTLITDQVTQTLVREVLKTEAIPVTVIIVLLAILVLKEAIKVWNGRIPRSSCCVTISRARQDPPRVLAHASTQTEEKLNP